MLARPYPHGQHPVDTGKSPSEVTLEEARRAVSFPLTLPRTLPAEARIVRCLIDPEETPQWVGISWAVDPGHAYTVHLRQGPAVAIEARRFQGRDLLREGIRLRVEEGGPRERRRQEIVLEIDGSWFELHSDLPFETTLEIAMSLRDRS